MCIVQTRWGLGLPVDLRPEQTQRTFKVLSYAGKPFYPLTLAGYKLALCLGYLRFIEGTRMRGFRIFTIAVGIVCVLIQLSFILLNLFNCLPIARNFDRTVPGHCFPFFPVQYPMAIVSILCDVIVFLLPIPLFTRLALSRGVVLGLCILFGCGLVTTVCSIARTCYLKDVGPNGNGDNTMVVLLGSVEGNVGIIMSCLPFLRALLANIIRSGGRSVFGYRSGQSGTGPTKKSSQGYNMDAFQGKSQAVVTTSGLHHTRRVSHNGSEEAILFDGQDVSNGIVKTTQVYIEEEEMDQSERKT